MKTATLSSTEQRRLGEVSPRLLRGLVAAGAFFLALSIPFGFITGWEQFFRSYLTNYAFFLSLSVGALFFTILHHLVRAGWSVTVRRLAELIAANLFPAMALLLIPLLIGMKALYPWAHTESLPAAERKLIEIKSAYLNPAFFIIRCAVYFLIWGGLARYFFRRSVEQDATGDVELSRRMQRYSAPGMLAFALTTTLAAFDLLMSLHPEFYSTIFGVYFFSGGVVSFFALLALLAMALQKRGLLQTSITTEHYQDLGKFVFGFTVFWAYIAFSQYMLIWYANLPEETFWYRVRTQGFWGWASLILLLGHFVAPFLWLMSRHQKRRTATLAFGAGWMILMHWLDVCWLVMPARDLHVAQLYAPHGEHAAAHGGSALMTVFLAATLFIGIGGLYVAALLARMRSCALLAERDPRLNESLAFENF